MGLMSAGARRKKASKLCKEYCPGPSSSRQINPPPRTCVVLWRNKKEKKKKGAPRPIHSADKSNLRNCIRTDLREKLE